MASELIPLEGIEKSGFIADTPAANLPPGAWSDVRNVRFKDGAIRKILGESNIFEDSTATALFLNIRFVIYWENPNERQYVVVERTGTFPNQIDNLYTVTLNSDGFGERQPRGTASISEAWQGTQFNGGFSIIMNNGIDTPQFITAEAGTTLGTTQFAPLPGWDSYAPSGGTTVSSVRAGIVIANGNLLLAGNLVERDSGGVVLRSLNGVVRSSDVAAPGTIPTNWNPFAIGVGTADELSIADTGTITAMQSLRGNVYVYTSDTISQLRISGQGLASVPITSEYGAVGQHAVYEFKGRHMVVGSDDIYQFSGNPGDIQSVADKRVRRFFLGNANALNISDTFIVRDQTFDELWVCYVSLNSVDGSFDEALIWNYTDNVWTKRDLPNARALTIGPVPGGGNQKDVYVFTGDTAIEDSGIQEIEVVTVTSDLNVKQPGTQDVQTFTLTPPGGVNNEFTAASDAFFLRVPNNFISGTTSMWSFDPDEADLVYATSVPTTTFTAGLTTTTALAEMSTAMIALRGTGTPAEEVTTSIASADVTNVADTPADITFQLDAGSGPFGAFNSQVYAGRAFSLGDRVITTDVNLVNNEGMVFVNARTNDANTYLYDTINGANMRFIIDEANSAIIMQNDGLDAFQTAGWLLDAGSDQLDGLNQVGQDYLSWTMQSGANFFDVVSYTGGPGPGYSGDVDSDEKASNAELARSWTVISAGGTLPANRLPAGRITLMTTGAGGGAHTPIGGGNGGGGGGGATAWITFTAVVGDVINWRGGTSGINGSSPTPLSDDDPATAAQTTLSDSFFTVTRGGEVIEIVRAGGGRAGQSSGARALGGARNKANPVASPFGGNGTIEDNDLAVNGVITEGTVSIAVIAEGGGVGGRGGGAGGTSAVQGGGGGAGGYSGPGGNGANLTFVNSNSDTANLITAAATATAGQGGGGGGGGSDATNRTAGFGGGVDIYGQGANGAVGQTGASVSQANQNGGGGSGGLTGQISATFNQIGGGSGGLSDSGNPGGGFAGFRILSGSATATYPTTGVANALVHTEAHTLTTPPGMMWIKGRDTAQVWTVWHQDFELPGVIGSNTNEPWIQLAGQNSVESGNGDNFNNTPPTATVFTVGNSTGGGDGRTNQSTQPYLNYLYGSNELTTTTNAILNGFDPDPNGSVYCGSYTSGTAIPAGGTIDGNVSFFVELGWKPSVMLTKNIEDSQPWQIHFLDPAGFNNGSATLASRFGYNDTGTPWAGLLRFLNIGDPDGLGGTATAAGFSVVSGNEQVNPSGTKSIIFMAIRDATPPDGGDLLFNNIPYTGTAVGRTITTGVDLTGTGGIILDSAPNGLRLYSTSSVAPGQQYWLSSSQSSKATAGLDHINNFGDGTVGIGSVPAINESGTDYIFHVLKTQTGLFSHARVPAPGGTPPAYVAVPHGLGATPAMVWVRTEQLSTASDASRHWRVFHQNMGDDFATDPSDARNYFMDLTLDNARNGTPNPTWGLASNFADRSVNNFLQGNDGNLNQGTSSFINTYSFGSDGNTAAAGEFEEISAGGGTRTIQDINLGWRPGFVIVKLKFGVANEGLGIGEKWGYWTTSRNSTDATLANVTTFFLDGGSANNVFGAEFTDTGFKISTSAGPTDQVGQWIYYAVREGASLSPDFNLYNLDGTAVELNEAGRAAIAAGVGNEAAVRASITAATTTGVTYTAGGTGADIQITQDRWAGFNNNTHEVINSNAIFNSVVDNTTFARAQAAPSYRSGAAGYEEMLVNLGTETELNSNVIITRGDGSPGVQIFVDVDGTDTTGAPVGTPSVYSFASPNGMYSESFSAGAGVNTVTQTVAALTAHVNAHTADPQYTAMDNNPTLTLTADQTGVDTDWVVSVQHSSATDGTAGTIVVGAVQNPTPGVDNIFNNNSSLSVMLPGSLSVSPVAVPLVIPMANQNDANTGDISASDVATAIEAATFSNWTDVAAGDAVTFTQAVGEFLNGVNITTELTKDDAPAATGSVTTAAAVNAIGRGPATATSVAVNIADPSLRTEPTDTFMFDGTAIRDGTFVADALSTYFNTFEQFTATAVTNTLSVTYNQFGANRYTSVINYSPSTFEAGVTRHNPLDTFDTTTPMSGTLTATVATPLIRDSALSTDVDPERPWPMNVLNEARNFVVSGGSENIRSMDLTNAFDGVKFESFVERRNHEIFPLVDTESMTGIYMNADGTRNTISGVTASAVTLDIGLQGVDNASKTVTIPIAGDQFYQFVVNGTGDLSDYKMDTRITNRLLNYRISNDSTDNWEIQSIAFATAKGGTR